MSPGVGFGGTADIPPLHIRDAQIAQVFGKGDQALVQAVALRSQRFEARDLDLHRHRVLAEAVHQRGEELPVARDLHPLFAIVGFSLVPDSNVGRQQTIVRIET